MSDGLTQYTESLNHYSKLVREKLGLEEASIISYFGLHLLASRYGNDLTKPEGRKILTEALGADLAVLQNHALHLLDNPHPALVLAAQAWADETLPHLDADVKPIPTAAELDQWASDNTMGMIDKFPLAFDPKLVVLLMATAVALKTGWTNKFRKLDNGMLYAESGAFRALGVVRTEAAGDVVVLVPEESKGINVMSVIAAPDYSPSQVWDAVEEIVARGPLNSLSFHTPDVDGHSWTVGEKTITAMTPNPPALQSATVPAWREKAKHDLKTAPGLNAFQDNFEEMACAQTAVGEYTHEGFSAAAVTALMVGRAYSMASHQVRVKTVDYVFDRPHALTAVVSHGEDSWVGLRLFDAWVK